MSTKISTSVNIAGVELKNPVMTASGTFGSGAEYSEFVDLSKLGAVVTKGVANVPWPGNPTPRVAEVYGIYQNEELVQLAMQICRWHHERYDGRGYPDGLKGEEIPIEVQVVSIADVYDALVSERVYKKAYSHKKAVEMILNGECGQFNPLLLECLQDIQDRIDEEFQNVENQSEEENQERKVHDQIMETTVLG